MMEAQLDDAPACRVLFRSELPDASPDGPPPGLEDVWPRLGGVLDHLHSLLRSNEGAMQAQQRGMIRDGCFLMPSLFADRVSDRCCRSWSHEFQFFYEFDAGPHGTYFWVSTQLDLGYSLQAAWFPERGVAVANLPGVVNPAQLDRFARALAAEPRKPACPAPWSGLPVGAVTGSFHMMHMLWNELPALDRLAEAGVPEAAQPGTFGIGVQFQPLGPLVEMFPELAPWLRPLRLPEVPAFNAAHSLVLGLGSWTITRGAQDRLLRVAARHTSGEAAERQARFKAAHGPVFWVSVKPPMRTVMDQVDLLAGLIAALHADHPGAGFILDGASLPWDYHANPNYTPWMHDLMDAAVANSATLIADVLDRLPPAVQARTVALNGLPFPEEATWGGLATFYVCHGGTMQNKIGWLHRIPGFIHSNHGFMRSVQGGPGVVAAGPACHYASPALVSDEAGGYTPLQLARRDQNYRMASLDRFVAEVRDAFLASCGAGWDASAAD